MRRIVSVWLRDWPITVWGRAPGRSRPPDDRPFALFEKGARGLRVTAANAAARAAGVCRGWTCADAQAACPGMVTAPCEPERDRAALKRLALWAERYSPAVAVDEAFADHQGLAFDITGADHLFGGEAALLTDLRQRLAALGARSRTAVADSLGAAWAMARFSGEAEAVVAEGGARQALRGLPLAALRLDEETLRLAGRLGLKRVGDLYPLPRAALARRFRGKAGALLVLRLDQALGELKEPLAPERAPPRYRVWENFAEPILIPEGVDVRLEGLAAALAAALERDGAGARRLRLTAFRVDGQVQTLEAGLGAPSRTPAHFVRLIRDKGVERLDLGFGADALMLSALSTEPLAQTQADLEAGRAAATPLAQVIDRLQARLGERAVLRPLATESRLPELAELWRPAGPERFPVGDDEGCERPVLLFHPPEPVEALAELPDGCPARFKWRRVQRRVVKAEGPERLCAEWWRPGRQDRPRRTRDYYKVEDEDGRRWWLFREGLYGREDAERAPSWWLHGAFP